MKPFSLHEDALLSNLTSFNVPTKKSLNLSRANGRSALKIELSG